MKFIALSLALLASVASAQEYLEIAGNPGLPGGPVANVFLALGKFQGKP